MEELDWADPKETSPDGANQVLVIATSSLVAAIALLQAPSGPEPFPEAEFDSIVQQAMKDWDVPGVAAAVVVDDKVVLLKGYGVKELGKPDPITPRSVFPLASVSKAFCAATVGILVDEGKMGWDDPVRKDLPSFALRDPIANQLVTIRDLFNHTTGLPRHDALWYKSGLSSAELLKRIPLLSPTLPIRSRTQYNNLMYTCAGLAAANVAGTSWENLVQTRILSPLGMKNTGPRAFDYLNALDRAAPHAKNDAMKQVVVPFLNADNIAPAGGINSCAEDMAQWVRMLLGRGTYEGKQILKEATVAEILRPQFVYGRPAGVSNAMSNFTMYGMGWAQRDVGGQMVIQHNGRLNGFSTSVTLLPRLKTGIVLLANNETNMAYVTPAAIVDLILRRPKYPYFFFDKWITGDEWQRAKRHEAFFLSERVPGTKPSLPLDAYVGKYSDPAYGTVEISKIKDNLAIKWFWYDAPLEHLHLDTFYGMITDGPGITILNTVMFQFDNRGKIVSLQVSGIDPDEMSRVLFRKEL